jgi:hypothetical protein
MKEIGRYESETGIRLDFDSETLEIKGVKSIKEKGKIITPEQFESIYGLSPEQVISLDEKPKAVKSEIEIEEISLTKEEPISSYSKVEPTFFQKIFWEIGTVSTVSENLINPNVSKIDESIGDTGISGWMSREPRTRVDRFIRNIIGSKEDFQTQREKGLSTGITGGVVSAYKPENYEGIERADIPKGNILERTRKAVSKFQEDVPLESTAFTRITLGEKFFSSKISFTNIPSN